MEVAVLLTLHHFADLSAATETMEPINCKGRARRNQHLGAPSRLPRQPRALMPGASATGTEDKTNRISVIILTVKNISMEY